MNLSDFTVIESFSPFNDSFAMLTLPTGTLTPGAEYKFQLVVNDGSKEGDASVIVKVRTGPTSGWLEVEKTSVKALEKITISG